MHTKGPNNRLATPLKSDKIRKKDQKQNTGAAATTSRQRHKGMSGGVTDGGGRERKLKKEKLVVKKEEEGVKGRKPRNDTTRLHHNHKSNNKMAGVRKLKRERKPVDYAEDSGSDAVDEERPHTANINNNVRVRKLKRDRKCVDYVDASSEDSEVEIMRLDEGKKKRRLRKRDRANPSVEHPNNSKLTNHKEDTMALLEKAVQKNKRIRLQDFTRKSSIKLLRNSKLLLKGKIRENLKITVNSFDDDETSSSLSAGENNVHDKLVDSVKIENHILSIKSELPNNARTTNNHVINNSHDALQCTTFSPLLLPEESPRGRGRPPGSKNKPKDPNSKTNVPNSAKLKSPKKTASSTSTSNCSNSDSDYKNKKSPPSATLKEDKSRGAHSSSTTTTNTIQDAPVFRPSAEEWRDPMAYINSIADKAEAYGMCKVVPQKGWRVSGCFSMVQWIPFELI